MEVLLVLLAAIALLVAVLMWSRRGQSSIGREPGSTVYDPGRDKYPPTA